MCKKTSVLVEDGFPKEMLTRGKRKVVIQSVDDDGFPENLAPAKQKMVKRGENSVLKALNIWVKY